LPALAANQKAILQFDAVDGNTEVFVNGQKVGEHILTPDYTGWDQPFHFDITDAVKAGQNVIAVQVASKSQDTASGINQPVHLLIGTPR
jgi:beta-galactosidase/beta-glucuronidase